MNYYIQGDAAKAQQIKAAFKKLGYDTGNLGFTSSQLYFTIEGKVEFMGTKSLQNLVKTHPDYKELELPIEPKFKVGDWVVKKSGYTFYGGNYAEQITLIDTDEDGEHIWLTSTTWVDDDDIRLWTIQDAKDGDILMSDKGNPFIFCEDRIHAGYHNIIAYCGINTMGSFCESSRKECWTYGTSLKPTTKEQRDLLFAKMKDAGYEWDADKKELRKIQPHYDIDNFKPKQWVLARDDDEWEWALTRFSHLSNGSASLFVCINGASFQQCIPFDGNANLLGTTDMPSEEFINW